MTWFHDMPLKRKLTLVIVAICTLVLCLACSVMAVVELVDFRRAMARDMTILADIIGKTNQAALTFDDAAAAKDLLQVLQSEPHVVAARLFNDTGDPFAEYRRQNTAVVLPALVGSDGYRFDLHDLILFNPIILNGKRIGTIYLQVDLQGLYARLGFFSGVFAVVLVGSFLLALLLSSRLQRPISGPILALAEVAKVVAERKDYTVRAPSQGGGETGALTDAFNHMLVQIHAQNRILRDSEERVRAVLNSTLNAVVVMDDRGLIIDWNARAESMFGLTRDEALGRDLVPTIVPECYREEHCRSREDFLASGRGPDLNQPLELSALRRDGSEFPVEWSVSAMKTDGTVTFCYFITDVTGRKHAEARLREQLIRFSLLNRITRAIGERQDIHSIFQVVIRSLEDNLPIDFSCVCLCHSTGMLTLSNIGIRSEGLAMKLGLSTDSAIPIGQNGLSRCVSGKLVYEPDIGPLDSPFTKLLAQGGLHALVAAPLLVENQVFGMLLVAREQANSFSSADCEFLQQLSEHVALAAHQTQLYTSLEQAYEDLRHTQQAVMQQERLRALGQMASGIAHDINNAISPMMLYTDSLLESEQNLSVRARKYLEIMKRAVGDVAHTVSRLGEFYRQSEAAPATTSVDLNEVVAQVVDLTRARWSDMPQQRGIVIQMKTELAGRVPLIKGIPSEVREALINLVFNAVDAMPDGGCLTLRTGATGKHDISRRSVGDHHVFVEVIDTGIGMDEETRRRCLEPFYTTKGVRGTGLGLGMVYGIAQRHHGEIVIDSAVGRGTTMRLNFPIPVSAPMPERGGHSAAPAIGRLHILVVDDDPILLKSLRDILEGDGHEIVAMNHGKAGIDAFRTAQANNEPFDVVITDLGMPDIDGRAVASAVKGMSAATPVVMLTGWGQRLIAEKDVPPHVDCVLSKPPKLHDLRTALAHYCQSVGSDSKGRV